MSKMKDTNFMYISARIRCLETKLLTRERMERMLDARTNEEAAKVLTECGYEGLEPLTAANLERSLSAAREDAFAELAEASPVPQLVDVFRVKYDYHNAKALIKCMATGQDADRLLIDAGRVSIKDLKEALMTGSDAEYGDLPAVLKDAMLTASDKLSATGDPQICDLALDAAYYGELTAMAKESGSKFLQGYVRLMIDTANLRSAVRVLRMNKDLEFMKGVLVAGGSVSVETLASAALAGTPLEELFPAELSDAAQLGNSTAKGGRLTAFEKTCDNALSAYLRQTQMMPFGDSVVVGYAAARENEITAARIILSGRLAGVPADAIRERLRDAYV